MSILPELNSLHLSNKTTIPSSGKEVLFRPFLVKEQKILLVAIESEDESMIFRTIADIIKTCFKDIDVNKLKVFDVDWLFVQNRISSIGAKSDVIISCKKCKQQNHVKVDLDHIKISPEPQKKIDNINISDNVIIKPKYPDFSSVVNNQMFLSAKSSTEQQFNLSVEIIDEIITKESVIKSSDIQKEKILEWIYTMTQEQYNKLLVFQDQIPVVSVETSFDCKGCGSKNNRVSRGAQDFLF